MRVHAVAPLADNRGPAPRLRLRVMLKMCSGVWLQPTCNLCALSLNSELRTLWKVENAVRYRAWERNNIARAMV
jgi:hypothetical protein